MPARHLSSLAISATQGNQDTGDDNNLCQHLTGGKVCIRIIAVSQYGDKTPDVEDLK